MKGNHIHPHPFPRKKSWLRSEYEKYTKSKSVLKCKYLEYHIYWRWSFSRTCLRISRCCMVPHWRTFLCNLAITERRCANAFIYYNHFRCPDIYFTSPTKSTSNIDTTLMQFYVHVSYSKLRVATHYTATIPKCFKRHRIHFLS